MKPLVAIKRLGYEALRRLDNLRHMARRDSHSFRESQRGMTALQKNVGSREWGNGELFPIPHSRLPIPHSRCVYCGAFFICTAPLELMARTSAPPLPITPTIGPRPSCVPGSSFNGNSVLTDPLSLLTVRLKLLSGGKVKTTLPLALKNR